MAAWVTVEEARLTDYYGEPRYNEIHRGIDIAGVSPGDTPPIFAAEAGTVVWVNRKLPGKNGQNIGIQTVNGGIWLYCHIEKIKVRVGQKVKEGQHIATMGKNGLSATAGVHLHLELWLGKNWWNSTDPLPYLQKHIDRFRFRDFDGDGKIDRGERIYVLDHPTLATVSNTVTKESTLSAAEVKQITDHVDRKFAELEKSVGYLVWSYRNARVDPRDAFGITRGIPADVWKQEFESEQPGAIPGRTFPAYKHLLNTNGFAKRIFDKLDGLLGRKTTDTTEETPK